MRRLVSMEPVGILNACTTYVRMNRARITATAMDSRYSRATDFLMRGAAGATSAEAMVPHSNRSGRNGPPWRAPRKPSYPGPFPGDEGSMWQALMVMTLMLPPPAAQRPGKGDAAGRLAQAMRTGTFDAADAASI